MLEATAGLGPDVENKIVVFERRGLARSAGYRLEDWNERGDGFLKIIDELRKILLPHYVVHDDVIFRAEDFEIFFGEIGNLAGNRRRYRSLAPEMWWPRCAPCRWQRASRWGLRSKAWLRDPFRRRCTSKRKGRR